MPEFVSQLVMLISFVFLVRSFRLIDQKDWIRARALWKATPVAMGIQYGIVVIFGVIMIDHLLNKDHIYPPSLFTALINLSFMAALYRVLKIRSRGM